MTIFILIIALAVYTFKLEVRINTLENEKTIKRIVEGKK